MAATVSLDNSSSSISGIMLYDAKNKKLIQPSPILWVVSVSTTGYESFGRMGEYGIHSNMYPVSVSISQDEIRVVNCTDNVEPPRRLFNGVPYSDSALCLSDMDLDMLRFLFNPSVDGCRALVRKIVATDGYLPASIIVNYMNKLYTHTFSFFKLAYFYDGRLPVGWSWVADCVVGSHVPYVDLPTGGCLQRPNPTTRSLSNRGLVSIFLSPGNICDYGGVNIFRLANVDNYYDVYPSYTPVFLSGGTLVINSDTVKSSRDGCARMFPYHSRYVFRSWYPYNSERVVLRPRRARVSNKHKEALLKALAYQAGMAYRGKDRCFVRGVGCNTRFGWSYRGSYYQNRQLPVTLSGAEIACRLVDNHKELKQIVRSHATASSIIGMDQVMEVSDFFLGKLEEYGGEVRNYYIGVQALTSREDLGRELLVMAEVNDEYICLPIIDFNIPESTY